MKSPIFIVGVGRSGTSLLQSMLNAHPDICFIPETQFLRKYVFTNQKWTSKDEITKLLSSDENLTRTGLNISEVILNSDSFFRVFQNMLKTYLSTKGKKIIGDKDPRNIDFLTKIYNYYPSAKVIHLVRDPRDVVLSRTKAAWSQHWPFFLHVFLYNAQILRGARLGKKLFEGNYTELKYEELIQDAQDSLKKIMQHLELEYHEDMLSFSNSAAELVSEREMQWKKETLGPLLKNNSGKWLNKFSSFQIGLIQNLSKKAMNIYFYEAYEVKLSGLEKIKMFIMSMFSKVFTLLYPLRLKFLK